MAISNRTRKHLWSRAGNQCAFPGCLQVLSTDVVVTSSGESIPTLIADEAHIRAQSPGGPRYDPGYADVDGFANLLLLCNTHHTLVDANDGIGYSVDDLIKMKSEHESNHDKRAALDSTLRAYIGGRYEAEGKLRFQQVQLNGPTVDSLFVDVPVGCRRDGSEAANLLRRIAQANPGDTEQIERTSGLIITGATQALLHPDWKGDAILLGGPGQGKSTVLQYVCQFHRARWLGESGYGADQTELVRHQAVERFPIRVDLRKYAQWAQEPDPTVRKKNKKGRPRPVDHPPLRGLETYIIEQIDQQSGVHDFTRHDFVAVLATKPVLVALDGLDEVANIEIRTAVVDEIAAVRGRLRADAADLLVLLATRPGTSLHALTGAGAFAQLHLQRLTPGLRLQFLQRWCTVSEIEVEAAAKLQEMFLDNRNVPHVEELASSPMQLAILLHLLHRRQLLPQQRTELYREYMQTFLDREQTEDKEPLLAEQRHVVEDTHAYLGWYLQAEAEQGRTSGSISRSKLRSLLRDYLRDQPEAQKLADEMYSAFVLRVLCLVEQDDTFEFQVQSLREYFAASYLFDKLDPRGKGNSRDDGLDALLAQPYWANVARFFVGMLAWGEVRGLIDNFEKAAKAVGPHPHARAMAATAVNDRVYDRQPRTRVREIVDFVLDGPGLILAQDGQLTSEGVPFVFGKKAGRDETIDHLKQRLLTPDHPAVHEAAAAGLLSHLEQAEGVRDWWWAEQSQGSTWLTIAAQLGALADASSVEIEALEASISGYSDPNVWTAVALITGGLDKPSEELAQAVLVDLNRGAAEGPIPSEWQTEYEFLAAAATNVLRGPHAADMLILDHEFFQRGSTVTLRVKREMLLLRSSAFTSAQLPSEWATYLRSVFEAWGDGWMLRRSTAMLPRSLDLISTGAYLEGPLASVLELERQFRTHRTDDNWLASQLEVGFDPAILMLNLLSVLENATAPTISKLSSTIDASVESLEPKQYKAVEHALYEGTVTQRMHRFDLQQQLRLQALNVSGRTLWLLWIASNDSTRAAMGKQIEASLRDVLEAGTGLAKRALQAAKTSRTLKADIFRGTRDLLSEEGWSEDVSTITLSLRNAREILSFPHEWPRDLIRLAVDVLATHTDQRSKPVAEVAVKNQWFQG